jgi:hypothetical protein
VNKRFVKKQDEIFLADPCFSFGLTGGMLSTIKAEKQKKEKGKWFCYLLIVF